jgi:beta-lactamase superfamily II metal-dependent hydrolase
MASELLMVFYDVQHGSATYIKTPNGKHIMIDLGTGSIQDSNATFSPLLRLKNKWKVESLDLVVITHPHRDHIDDIFNFDKLSPRALRRPKHLTEEDIRAGNKSEGEEKKKIDKYLEIDGQYNSPLETGEKVQAPANNGGVKMLHFHPKKCATSNLNNHSIVTVLSYAGSKIIIPGDNESASWKELLEDDEFVEAIKGTDILLASHHGRESGFCKELFDHIEPSLVLISDGPETDTSVTDKYYGVTTEKGWNVYKRSSDDPPEQRWVLTTRSDKAIVVRFGISDAKKKYMNVTVA